MLWSRLTFAVMFAILGSWAMALVCLCLFIVEPLLYRRINQWADEMEASA